MKFSDFASVALVHGARQGRSAIIIPCYDEHETLMQHLSLLPRQDCKDFDAILVLGSRYPEGKIISFLKNAKLGFAVVVAKRKEDTGSAGGFFTGQLYALENGYGRMILADADCLPADSGLVGALLGKKGADFVSPRVLLSQGGADVAKEADRKHVSIAYYGMVSRKLVEARGLYFYPAYTGCDDAEYMERLGAGREFVSASATHPYGMGNAAYSKPPKHWLYVMNTVMLIRSRKRRALNLARVASAMPVLFLFAPKYGRALASALFSSLMSYTYGKKLLEKLAAIDFSCGVDDGGWEKKAAHMSFADSGISKPLNELASRFREFFGKDVVLERSENDLALLFLPVFARRAVYRTAQGGIWLAKNENPAAWLAKLALLSFALLFSFLFVFAFALVQPLRRPRTERFGLG